MKYGIVVSVSKTRFGEVVFKEDVEQNILKAKRFGYHGVELAVRQPAQVPVDNILKLVNDYGLTIPAIGTGQIYVDDRLSFVDSDRRIRTQAVERTKAIIDIAAHFKAAVVIGLVRGTIELSEEDREAQMQAAEAKIVECLTACLDYSKANGTRFLLEPLHRYHTNIFNRLEEAAGFLARYQSALGTDRIGILADTWHMNIEEPSIAGSLRQYGSAVKHVHLADSNRWAPGYGHIDFLAVYDALQEDGYEGFLTFEVLPLPDPDTAARTAIAHMHEVETEWNRLRG